jgi:hypothetical protein
LVPGAGAFVVDANALAPEFVEMEWIQSDRGEFLQLRSGLICSTVEIRFSASHCCLYFSSEGTSTSFWNLPSPQQTSSEITKSREKKETKKKKHAEVNKQSSSA